MIYIKKQSTPPKIFHATQRMRDSERWSTISEGDTAAVRSCFEDLEYYDEEQQKYICAKGFIRSELLKEQHYLCAYCMQSIKDDGLVTKIEHYSPLSKDKNRALDYQNFLAVCKGGELPGWELNTGEDRTREKGVLCCEAVKGDETELTIDPRNQGMMDHIAYYREGLIYFEGLTDYSEEICEKIQNDLNIHLQLNGVLKPDGSRQDTSTRLVYNRSATYRAMEDVLRRLRKAGKLTVTEIEQRIDSIISADKMEEFAGVKLFVLNRERNRMLKRQE